MKIRRYVPFVLAAALACGIPASQVSGAVSSGTSCAISIIEQAVGVPSIPAILQTCGITIDDLIALITSLLSAGTSDAGAASAVPTPYELHLRDTLAAARAYKAAHP